VLCCYLREQVAWEARQGGETWVERTPTAAVVTGADSSGEGEDAADRVAPPVSITKRKEEWRGNAGREANWACGRGAGE